MRPCCVQVAMKVYQTLWQVTAYVGTSEEGQSNRITARSAQNLQMLIRGENETVCLRQKYRRSIVRRRLADAQQSVACCSRVLQALQRGQRQASCASIMAGEGISGIALSTEPAAAVTGLLRTSALEDAKLAWQQLCLDANAARPTDFVASSVMTEPTTCLIEGRLQQPR